MRREELGDLVAFLAVAEERSFTRAAARLGTSQSALSHTIRRLEERLEVRLLTRTTRSVRPPKRANSCLMQSGQTAKIGASAGYLSDFRDRPSGTIRITTSEHAAQTVLWPVIGQVPRRLSRRSHRAQRGVRSLTDIVSERFDAGVRLGEQVAS